MTTAQADSTSPTKVLQGKIIEAEVKVSVDAARALPLVCALYAVESSDGVWLCAFYGANRSVFDFLPQKGAEVDEKKLGVTFWTKEFIPKGQYRSELWQEFKKSKLMAYGGHGG